MTRTLWIVAALALATAATSHGRFLVAASPWLAPIFLVRFVRSAPARLAWPGFVALHGVALTIAYYELVPLPLPAAIGMFLVLSAVLGLVFLLDRRLAARSGSLLATLALPAGWAAYDWLTGTFSPNGSWGSPAYGLVGQTTVLQLASVFGWTGLTFLLAWVGATVNWCWDARAAGRSDRRGLVALAAVLVGVLTFGSARLSGGAPESSFRAALLAGPDTFQGEHLEEVWMYTRGLELTDEQLAAARAQLEARRESQLALTAAALADGADLAAWAEVNSAITAAEEEAWLAGAAEVAARAQGWVALGLFVFHPATGAPPENRCVLFGPGGELVWDFQKATRVPGDSHAVGDGVLPVADTELGRLSTAICFDLDFPRLFDQAGLAEVDVLLAPSNDWAEVRRAHADMAVVRAVEQGFALVRPTKDGLALACDPYGRTLGRRETLAREDSTLVVDVPAAGVRTLYASGGRAFGWLCCAAFAAAVFATLRRQNV